MSLLVSVVLPVIDEAETLPGALASIPSGWEVVVVDGGSCDGTPEVAERDPCRPRLLHVGGGRAEQQNAGAAAAGGEVLVFLHADSRLPPDAARSLAAVLRDPAVLGGNFALRFDGADRFGRVLGVWYAVQRRAGIYYGDSVLWLRRGAWEGLGGFRPLAIMEDYDLVRRLERRGRTACLPGPAVTSGRRWRALGVRRTVLSWIVIRWLWLLGVPDTALAHLYRRAR